MRTAFSITALLALLNVSSAFMAGRAPVRSIGGLAATTMAPETTIKEIPAPDFYWQYRLARLVEKKGTDLAYDATNYPELKNDKDLYDAYYLDLTLQGKMDGFDWRAEKEINDNEWKKIYKQMCTWTQKVTKKGDTSNLPSNDFDLLKQFYPQLSFRDLDSPFVSDEVGENFPYANMKEMISAAAAGSLSVPGVSNTGATSIVASEVRAELAALREKSMKAIDDVYADAMKYAQNPFPDDEARAHYTSLKSKLANFPQGEAGWKTFRSNMEKEVDEMARLASKSFDPHHGGVSPTVEFQSKYGKNLDDMQERMAKYKANPQGFLESSILEKFGKSGLDVWKKSQEFSSKMEAMSAADKEATEKSFSDFLGSA